MKCKPMIRLTSWGRDIVNSQDETNSHVELEEGQNAVTEEERVTFRRFHTWSNLDIASIIPLERLSLGLSY